MFNLDKAVKIAKYSEIIYRGYSYAKDALFGIEWEFFERDDTQAMIVVDQAEKELYIVFRGTSSFKDWITNAQCKIVYSRIGGMHGGVYAAYQAVRDDIEKFVVKVFNDHKDYKIWICGHSLGGALATWCAYVMSLVVGIEAIAGVYTFGSMKVFDKDSCMEYNRILEEQTYRIVHGCDMVTYLPTGKYQHVEDLVYIDTKDNILVDEEGSKEGLKRMLWDKFREGTKNACTFQLFRKGHEMKRYVSSLEHGEVK